MMKRLIGLMLAICLIVTVLPAVGITVSAEDESVLVTLNTGKESVALEVTGNDVAYAVTDAAGNATKADSEPADKYVKLAIVDGVVTLYLNKATLNGDDNVIDLTTAGGRVNLVVLADSKITTKNNGIWHRRADLTIMGPGKLYIRNTEGAGSAIFVAAGGNLTFAENADVDISTNTGRCIYVDSGNLISWGNVKLTGAGATLVEVMNDMTVNKGTFAVTPTVQGTYVKLGNLTLNAGTLSVMKGGGLGDSMTWGIDAGNATFNGGTFKSNIGRALECRSKIIFNGGKHDLRTNFSNKLVYLVTAQSVIFNGGEVEMYCHGQSYFSSVEMKVGATGKYVAIAGASKVTAQTINGDTYPMNNMACYAYFGKPINEFTVEPDIAGWSTDDPAAKPVGESLYGTVVFRYATAADGEYTTTQPVMAGTYYMKATVAKGNQNCGGYVLGYDAIESDPIPFVIEQGEYVPQPETEPSQPETKPGDSAAKPAGSGTDVLTWVVVGVSVIAVAVVGFAAWMVISSRKKNS